MPLIKIPSGEITNLPYLEEIGKLHTPALLATGMCNLSEITDALGILDDNGCPEVTLSLIHIWFSTAVSNFSS